MKYCAVVALLTAFAIQASRTDLGRQLADFLLERSRQLELASFSRKHQINFLSVETDEDYVPKLLKLFKVRNKSMKRV